MTRQRLPQGSCRLRHGSPILTEWAPPDDSFLLLHASTTGYGYIKLDVAGAKISRIPFATFIPEDDLKALFAVIGPGAIVFTKFAATDTCHLYILLSIAHFRRQIQCNCPSPCSEGNRRPTSLYSSLLNLHICRSNIYSAIYLKFIPASPHDACLHQRCTIKQDVKIREAPQTDLRRLSWTNKSSGGYEVS